MSWRDWVLRRILRLRSERLYGLCTLYRDAYRCENNEDMFTNGEHALLERAVPRCRVVFDVGANVGRWASQVFRLNPHVQLHCFEPSAETYDRLVASGLPSHAVLNHLGLGAEDSDASLHVYDGASGWNSLYARSGVASPLRFEGVRLRRFDGYCAEARLDRVDFCKLDVEGHELSVLQGMGGFLTEQRVGLIQFEYGGCNIDSRVLLKDFFELLIPLGYRLGKLCPCGLRLHTKYDPRLETFQYQNWLAATPAFLEKIDINKG